MKTDMTAWKDVTGINEEMKINLIKMRYNKSE